MAILIKSNGKLTMAYPYDELLFTYPEVKVLLTGSEKGIVKIHVLMKGNEPILKVWSDYEAKLNQSPLNKKASLISKHYGENELYGDVLIEGDVEIILDELKIVFPYLPLSPAKRKRK